MLSARGLVRRYGATPAVELEALDLEAGTITAVVGPNGSGKSTMLRLLAFLERPDAGTLTLDGKPVESRVERRKARRKVTLVEQRPFLFPGTVTDNIRYALALHGIRGQEISRAVAESLERLSLGDYAGRSSSALSEGESQRVALARALALSPQVLLLDEPLSGADRAAGRDFHRALEEERSRGTAICYASHLIEEAYRWSSDVIGLAHGRLSPVTPENLFRVNLPEGSGTRVVDVGPLKVRVMTDRTGPSTVVIPPEDIVVSRTPLAASTQNRFRGRVTRISEDGKGGVTLTVDAGVDLSVRITRKALDELELGLATEVVLSVKTMAVRVY
ncbi:MAG: ABC transporter ATP-binding protein [Gemmatimonadales bacterium]